MFRLQLFNIALVLLALVGMAGCGSTPNKVAKYEVIEPIKVHSTEVFEWNNDASRAANFAKMGHKAGLGFGLRDKSNPKGNIQGDTSNKFLDVATGFLAMDLGTGLATAFNENQRDNKTRFAPYMVDFVDAKQENLSEAELAELVIASLKVKMERALNKTEYAKSIIRAYSDNNPLGMVTSRVLLQGDICIEGTNYLMPDSRKTRKIGVRNADMIIGLNKSAIDVDKSCGFEVGSSITGKVDGKFIVVHEIVASNLNVYIAQQIAMHTDMAIIFPEYLSFHHASDMQEKYTFKYDYTFVTYKGEQLLFDNREVSTEPAF
ncbi:hypothetical protein ACOI22_09655 [Glaciecola sp. 2405UD65-10]|uniref:hypothetical protein n=1 Tax=Glaciecola sp. 2405UD65-10 TaxID=3397244 RepID=UPI003B58BEC9